MKKEVLEKVIALMVAAFGLVAALAWNQAVQAIFVKIFGTASSITAMLIYAVVITIVAVAVIIGMGMIAEKTKK